jgi:hypothetical protein
MHLSGFDDTSTSADFGYDFRVRKSGDVDITLLGRVVATLRGAVAQRFVDLVEASDDEDEQQALMANEVVANKRKAQRS